MMNHVNLIATLTSVLLLNSTAWCAIVGVGLGTVAPPPTLGPYTMTPFPDDPRPLWEQVSAVASPLGGELAFSDPLKHVRVGEGWWWWWGHGYTGDLYFLIGEYPQGASYTLDLPPQTKAFYLYGNHDLTSYADITVIADDGTSIKQTVLLLARYFGFYQDNPDGPDLKSLTVSTLAPAALAVGEFGIAIPEPGALVLLGAGGLILLRRRAERARFTPRAPAGRTAPWRCGRCARCSGRAGGRS